MSLQIRWVVLDGRFAGRYSPDGWHETLDDQAFLGTLWTTTSNSSIGNSSSANMTFPFVGSSFNLFGRMNSSDDGISPGINCTVDGSIVQPNLFEPSGLFSCPWSGNGRIHHTFHLSTELNGGSVAVDSVWYLPQTLSYTPPEYSFVVLRHNDPEVIYNTKGWRPIEADGSSATLIDGINSTLSLVFRGTHVIAEGWRYPRAGLRNSSATYSINAGSFVPFELLPPNPPSEIIRNQTLFEIANLEAGDHHLKVTYLGPSTPLVLEQFFVKGGNLLFINDRPTEESAAPSPNELSSDLVIVIALLVVGTGVAGAILYWRYAWIYRRGPDWLRPFKKPQAQANQRNSRQSSLTRQPLPPAYQPPLNEYSHTYPPPAPPYLPPPSYQDPPAANTGQPVDQQVSSRGM